MHRSGNLWWGMTLIVLGIMFLLDTMNIMDFGDFVRTYWPGLLIIWGVSILLSRSRVSRVSSGGGTVNSSSPVEGVNDLFNDRNENPESELVNYSSVFGDLSLRPQSGNFKGGTVSTVFGDTTLDLTSSTLADGENRLKLSGVFGDVSIMLSPSMPYTIAGHSLFGAVQAGGQKRDGFSSTLTLQSPEYSTAGKKLFIDVSQVFGNITLTR